ncbi:hypothetical protein PV04_03864 [Phialophora macrospora]|uniref:Uncharacterized protein n=1 Tax=Phialophora macrospora TaxID=1851006 RepID=A0A0D2GHH5_9EURO|nr:hypothetical protein PV04_03864 [Phialophora macrospora]
MSDLQQASPENAGDPDAVSSKPTEDTVQGRIRPRWEPQPRSDDQLKTRPCPQVDRLWWLYHHSPDPDRPQRVVDILPDGSLLSLAKPDQDIDCLMIHPGVPECHSDHHRR